MAGAADGGAAISTGDVPAPVAGAPDTATAAPAPGPASGEKSANLLFTMSAKRATVTKQGVLLEGVSPVVTYVSDVPSRHAGMTPAPLVTGFTLLSCCSCLLCPSHQWSIPTEGLKKCAHGFDDLKRMANRRCFFLSEEIKKERKGKGRGGEGRGKAWQENGVLRGSCTGYFDGP